MKNEENKQEEKGGDLTMQISEIFASLESLDQELGANLETFNKNMETVANSKDATNCLNYISGKLAPSYTSKAQPGKISYEQPARNQDYKFSPEHYKKQKDNEANEEEQEEDLQGKHSRWSREDSDSKKKKKLAGHHKKVMNSKSKPCLHQKILTLIKQAIQQTSINTSNSLI